MKRFSVDAARCTGCLSCVDVCATKCIRPAEGIPAPVEGRTCTLCFHCQAACPFQAICFEGVEPGEQYPAWSDRPVERTVQARRSIRRFKAEPPAREEIAAALEAARYAPSAKNMRAHAFTVVYGREKTDRVRQLAAEYLTEQGMFPSLVRGLRGEAHDSVTCGAPCLILCHGETGLDYVDTDAVIAMTTLELILAERGIGTCWAGFLRRFINASPALRAYLGLPEDRSVCAAMMVGFSDQAFSSPAYREAVDTRWV